MVKLILSLHPEKYPKSKFKEVIKSNSAGYLSEVNTYELGIAGHN